MAEDIKTNLDLLHELRDALKSFSSEATGALENLTEDIERLSKKDAADPESIQLAADMIAGVKGFKDALTELAAKN